jgi:hypothetical protein
VCYVISADGVGRDRSVCPSNGNASTPPSVRFFGENTDNSGIDKSVHANLRDALVSKRTQMSERGMQDTTKVFSFIQTLSSMNHLDDIPFWAPDNNDADLQKEALHLFEALRQLMHAPYTPWWGRIWVVQEVILPPEITVICGTVSAPWTIFARAASRSLYHIHHCCSRQAGTLPRDYLHVLEDFCQRVLDIEDLRSAFVWKSANLAGEDARVTKGESHDPLVEQRSLISLLRRYRNRKASDPRDKVYALLSLVQRNQDRTALVPDYSLDEPEVFRRAALECIYGSRSLSILHDDLARKYRQDLPTWVPDWEAAGNLTHNTRMDAISMYDICASDSVSIDTVRPHSDGVLTVSGIYVDDVTDLGEVMFSDSADAVRKTLINWLLLKNGVPMADGTDRVLWRVLCADVILYPQNNNTKETFRRAGLQDELMFVTWALISEKSPFSVNRAYKLYDYISTTAQSWKLILAFEISISTGDVEQAAKDFAVLYPNKEQRIDFFLRVLDSERVNDDQLVDQVGKFVKYGTLSDRELGELELHFRLETPTTQGSPATRTQTEAEDKAMALQARLRAFSQMLWSKVLGHVRPKLLIRLGDASGIGNIPLETQVSIVNNSIASATKARRFFLTSRGYMGLGPAGLQRRDKIYLIKGGRTPFALRNTVTDWPQDVPAGGLQVLGDSYVHDLMDSRTFMKGLLKSRSRRWQDIDLV